MRNITLILSLVMGFALNAQIYYYLPPAPGNPGGLNADDEYPAGGGLDASWTSILAGGNTTPVWSPAQNVPFTFKFNNITETQYKVSSSGVLTFATGNSTAAPSTTPAVIPSSSIPDKSIMVWGITGSGSNDNIVTKTFGTAPNRQHWIFFSSYTMPGNASAWTYWSIVLEETTNNIYIVDQRNANGTLSATLGIQVNGTTAYSVAGSPNVGHLSGADATAADNFYYAFLEGPQPQRDMAGVSVNLANFLTLSSAPYDVEAEFKNLGTATITSADINYSINGGATVTQSLTGLNIASLASATLTHPTQWNPTAGNYNVDVWLTNLNGGADEKPANDKASKNLDVVAGATQRYSVFETFTSSTCPPCVPGNINTEGIFAANPGEYVSVKYQMSWPGTGDPYFTAEGNGKRNYYGINSVPWLMIDGGWNGNSNSLTQAVFDNFTGIPAFVQMNARYSISGQTVCVDVEIDPLSDINVNDLKLHVAIKEKFTDNNVKSNGETEFYHVMKKMVPDENGLTIPGLVNGQHAKYSQCYTFNGSYRLPNNAGDPINHATEHSVEEFSDLAVAVWLQRQSTKEVYQAAEAMQVIGINDFDPLTHNLLVYPNPASDFTTLSIDMDRTAIANVDVVNALGQVVLSTSNNVESGTNKIKIATDAMSAGIYFVKVEIDGQTQTLKLNVQ